ncbi:hypothetical protein Pmani_028858 [Petrolisthes manimaculis]|uniref:PH domain-containing protein n=1 Tax=Petrolisthes manimaculis TaxID=1843537 RepID=A0AAE1P1E9_9EUCA|nr:hypothetical protein Pmani_028858 [Petrolisthes manimaculis]
MGEYGKDSEWPQPSPFVRGSSLRTTWRGHGSKAVPPRVPARLSLKQQDRPPRPPPRQSEDQVGRSQSLIHSATHQDGPPPLSPHCPVNKSRSFSEETRTRVRSWDRSGPTSPQPQTSTFFFPSTVNESLLNHDSVETWNTQHIPTPPLSPTYQIPPSIQRRAAPCVPTSSHDAFKSQPPTVGHDNKKGFFSLFKRGTSSPHHNGSQSTEQHSVGNHKTFISNSKAHGVDPLKLPTVSNLRGRSQTPSPHRHGPPPSPTTYRRVRHGSDNSPAFVFRRSGSVPMQRTGGLSQRAGQDVTTAWGRIMSQSMRVPDTRHQTRFYGEHSKGHCPDSSESGKNPWSDSAFMQWPLKSAIDTTAPPSLAPRIPDTRQENHRGSTTSTVAEDHLGQELEGSRTCLLPKSRQSTTHSQVVRPSLSLRAGRENGGFVGYPNTSHSSPSTPTTVPTPKTFTRPAPLPPPSAPNGVEGWSLFGSGVEQVESLPPVDNFTYLLANDQEYLKCLRQLLNDHHAMTQHTPSHIRQHFDQVFSLLEQITHFQEEVHERLKETGGDVILLALALRDNQFQYYDRYIVMTSTVQKEFERYSTYFQEHFPDLLRNILKPTFRLNFYAMILESFKKECGVEERSEVEATVAYLNRLKRVANTEMTLKAVADSPVDLRLGGDLLHQGELVCLAGGSLQRKKYCVILFENLLVITSSKMSFYKYKVHYRVEQLEKVEVTGSTDLVLHVLTEGQAQHTTIKFRARTQLLRSQWVEYLEKIANENQCVGQGGRRARMVPGLQRECSRPIPLHIFSLYPSLNHSFTHQQTHHTIIDQCHLEEHWVQLISREKSNLRNLSVFLNPETLVPPTHINKLLEKLYEIHSKGILPILENTRSVGEMLEWFIMNLDLFSIYKEYLVARSEVLLDQDYATPRLYISPVQHFTFYVAWLQQLVSHPEHSSAAKKVIFRFYDYVRQAQLQLLKQAIVSGRVDFHRSGDFIRYDKMEVRTRKKELRGGSYFALLFENVIILTKPKPPFYEYTWDIWLDQANLGPPVQSESTFKLEVRQGGGREPVTYDFSATSSTVKQEWLTCIHNQMLEQADKIRKRLSQ